jgi:hypothetical protein
MFRSKRRSEQERPVSSEQERSVSSEHEERIARGRASVIAVRDGIIRRREAAQEEILRELVPENGNRWIISGADYAPFGAICDKHDCDNLNVGGHPLIATRVYEGKSVYHVLGENAKTVEPEGEVLEALATRQRRMDEQKARRQSQPVTRYPSSVESDTRRYSEREIVYVLERITSEGRFFKIGKTSRNDVSRRAYEVRSTIVSYTNEVRERHVHRELRHSRVDRRDLPAEITAAHGPTEWFRPTPEVERFAFDGVLPSGRTARMVADRAA